MRILVITSVLPYPLDSGGAQAVYNMVDNIRAKHKICLLFNQNKHNSTANADRLRQIWPDVELIPYSYARQMRHPRFLFDKAVRAIKLHTVRNSTRFVAERTLKPYGYYMSGDFVGFVNNVIRTRRIDVVETNFHPYLQLIRHLPDEVCKVFIHHEIRFVRNERFLKDFRLTASEQALMDEVKNKEIEDLNLCDRIVTLTDDDKRTLAASGVKPRIDVSPAAINTRTSTYRKWNGKVVFIGGYGHFPNKEGIDWFVEKVAGKTHPDVNLTIIGKGWPDSYETTSVHRAGFVPVLADATRDAIMIVPILTGSGMRMKILEAAAMGIPFVTTSVGVEGLDFRHNEACLVADTPEEFAESLSMLMADDSLRRRLAQKASEIYASKYSPAALSNIREGILRSAFEEKENKTNKTK